jgi:hypothetical protein
MIELTKMIVDLLIQYHAWATARPKHEMKLSAARLEKNINVVLTVEQEQGMSSASSYHISHFVGRPISRALTFFPPLRDCFGVLQS